jgi:hypothetical protein
VNGYSTLARSSSSLPGQKTVALDIGEGWLHEAEKLVQESCGKLGVKLEVSCILGSTTIPQTLDLLRLLRTYYDNVPDFIQT